MPTTQNAVNNHEYRSVHITALVESATNPRKRFDAKSLEELAASFKTQGILAPLLVRELDESKYEVVAGARRLRAAKLAELEKLPVRVVKLTDAEAIEAQCVENLQREDIHPLEEALGFKSLLELGEPAYTIATIASRAGKSEAYVYGRIRLADLIPPVAEAFLKDQITIGHALLIAKLPASQQQEAFAAAFRGQWTSEGNSQVLIPARELAAWIESNILLQLASAPFDKQDETLVTQSALSKQITEIERQHKFHLFNRKNKRTVELTDVGRIFVEEARSALLHIDRAVQLGCAAREGTDGILTIGHSSDADQAWVSAILSIRLPLYPKLRIQLISEFSNELVRSVMAGELNLALVTAPLANSQITAVPFALTSLYAALPESHPAAQKEHVALQDLIQDDWILFGRRVHPVVHDAIMDAAGREGITPKNAHDIITAQQAIHLVSERVGVAILTTPTCVGLTAHGIVIKPISDTSLSFDTCLIMRTDDDSRLANEFARSFLRRYQPRRTPPKQLELGLSA